MGRKDYFLLFIILFFLMGCATYGKDASHGTALKGIEAPQLPEFRPPAVKEGSLWSDVGGISLFPDRRARKVGDIVTVRIVEDPEAELNANTSTSRNSGISASKLKVLDYTQKLFKKVAPNPEQDDLMLASLGMKFDGKASSDRDGHIKAYISAMVLKTLPNGNLFISGRREIRVNHETQYITITGMVRPEDISPSNEVSSTYVANARITYAGVGPLADKQKPGWLGRIVDHVWPF